ncbi:MAG TPA: cytochrome c oxidase assembly protein [Nitrososphaerales archaeon]|nr:cytochrome c oxidase assembly protein [Nitrososphaerales archaeon]
MERGGLRRVLFSTECLGILLFVFATGFPPFDDVTEVDLTTHMLQHVLIVFAGIMIAYPHLGRRLLKEGRGVWFPRLALILSVAIIVFWHFPDPWDAAVLNPAVHALEHFCFLGVGLLCGSWLLLLSDSGKIGALMAAFFGHMGYAVALISPWGTQVYPLYSLPDQVLLGWILLLTGPSLIVGVAYVIARNPSWLGGFSGAKGGAGPRAAFLNMGRPPRWVAPVLSAVLLLALVAYFTATAYALAGPQPTENGPTVYISETPVSWQYSPQQIQVELGVNSTVTWVSHSIAYDTVTDRGGAFGSGAIPPGGTFTHTFTAPGVYEYYCLYHPWMTGTITVLPAGG